MKIAKIVAKSHFVVIVACDSGSCFLLLWFFLAVNAHFKLVKAEAVHTIDVALGNDGLAVGFLDDAEDVHALMLAAHHHDNLDSSLGVPACAIQYRAATVGFLDDVVGDLLPLMADDEELHTLTRVVDHAVGSHRVDDHKDETVHDLVNRVEKQPGRADDEHVTVHHRASERDSAVLSHHGGDDVGAARASIVGEYDTQAQTAQHSAQNHVHERLLLDDGRGE